MDDVPVYKRREAGEEKIIAEQTDEVSNNYSL